MRKISAKAYHALRKAIAAIIWNKRPFETYLRTAQRPARLAGRTTVW